MVSANEIRLQQIKKKVYVGAEDKIALKNDKKL
jgi:hypothetical protein